MRPLTALFSLSLVVTLSSCDFRSETAKREMEKYTATPTPRSPTPTEAPIDPADVVRVDSDLDGTIINADGNDGKKTASCTKYDRVRVNGSRSTVTIKGACKQIMINGDGNQVASDAVSEFVINGSENMITYTRFVNGKRPMIKQTAEGNTIEKVAAAAPAKPK